MTSNDKVRVEKLLRRLDDAMGEHALEHPETPGDEAVRALQATTSALAEKLGGSPVITAALGLRMVESDFTRAVRTLAVVYQQDQPDAIVGAIITAKVAR